MNFITTDRHLGVSLLHQDYALASIDIGFIGIGLILAWATYKVWRKRDSILKLPVKKAKKQLALKTENFTELQGSKELS